MIRSPEGIEVSVAGIRSLHGIVVKLSVKTIDDPPKSALAP